MLKTIAISLFFSLPVFAEDGAGFAEHKAKMIAEIDQRISKMNEHKSCISAATNPEGMKACHEKMQEFHKEQRMEHMQNRKERLDKKIENMKSK